MRETIQFHLARAMDARALARIALASDRKDRIGLAKHHYKQARNELAEAKREKGNGDAR
jgi:hypothetical protein